MARQTRPAGQGPAAAAGPESGSAGAAAARVVDLTGESPELVAFVLLRYLAQIERAASRTAATPQNFDRKWLLDAYAECLEAVKGERAREAGQATQSSATVAGTRSGRK